MSLEVLSTLASVGTFVVIATTAAAALVQLRHMRGGNQIAVYQHLEQTLEAPEVLASQRFISAELPERMKDPTFRHALTQIPLGDKARSILPVMNAFENMGNLVKHGFIDRGVVLDSYGAQIVGYWRALSAVIPILRKTQGDAVGINFEYLSALSQQALDDRTFDVYPRGVARMPVDRSWLEVDASEEARSSRNEAKS